ncbi:MAG TPA: Ig-like domain-containing protein [Verrucomicrobiae bacterium]|jgi:RNA polymerase sigma-70 factor (ECF subfamily)
MKIKPLLTALLLGIVCQFAPQTTVAQDIDSMPPVVVKTVPESGSKNVAPGEYVIKVTFSKKMSDHSWSWSNAWQNSSPDFIGDPQYDPAHKTCSVKVKLEPNKTYGFWLNSENYHGFRDAEGHTGVPYLLVFKTKSN